MCSKNRKGCMSRHPVLCVGVVALAMLGAYGIFKAVKKNKKNLSGTVKKCTADCVQKCEEMCESMCTAVCDKMEAACRQMTSAQPGAGQSPQSDSQPQERQGTQADSQQGSRKNSKSGSEDGEQ